MEKLPGSSRLVGDRRSQQLIDYLESLEGQIGQGAVIYYDYPLFRDADDVLYRSRVLMASQSRGVQVFAVPDLVERELSEQAVAHLDQDLSQLISIIYGKLIKSRLLRKSVRQLRPEVQGFIILTDIENPEALNTGQLENPVITSLGTIRDSLFHNNSEVLTAEAWEELRSILEGAKGLLRPKERNLTARAPESKPVLLAKLENEIANFDANQRRAAISIVEGPQRIRGLAGSGKTIVLAMKAAHLHLNDPQATILFTFYTKSLYAFLKRLVTRFYRQFNDRDPDWTRIQILHAWGGKSVEGVYYNASIDAGEAPLTFQQASALGANAFDQACKALLTTGKVLPKYDYVLMDEAQDFPPAFFRLCFEVTKGGEYDRNIVWAYDELQNIISVRMKTPQETFGVDANGVPLIDLDRATESSPYGSHDIVLHKCYRNPREVLVTAHAIGFGIYSDVMVQMLENKEHWEDVGYIVEEGDCKPGQKTVILRPAENSPLSISSLQTPKQIISWHVAEDFAAEIDWAARCITELIGEGLRADDIMVIALDDRAARSYFRSLSDSLTLHGIRVNDVLADPYNPPAFTIDDHVTLTTVYRAKGNEAAVVIAIGIEAIYPARKLQRGRNKIFTAFTRAKAWLRVSGIGEEAGFFFRELDTALKNFPRLKFKYPDPEKIVTLQRDLSDRASRLKKLQDELSEQMELLGLDEEEKEQFVTSLTRRKR